MVEIGLSGGIGSGKSSACKVFMALGIPVYTADVEAKKLMQNDTELQNEIVHIIGKDAYTDGILQTKHIAEIIFTDTEKKKHIENCIHPRVQKHYKEWVCKQRAAYVIHENALMFNSGTYTQFHASIYVYCPKDLRILRVMKRDTSTEEQIRARMSSQADDAVCVELASYVIHNDNTQLMIPQILDIHSHIIRSYG